MYSRLKLHIRPTDCAVEVRRASRRDVPDDRNPQRAGGGAEPNLQSVVLKLKYQKNIETWVHAATPTLARKDNTVEI